MANHQESADRNRRLLERIEPIHKKLQTVRLFLGIQVFDADLIDFNPFGAGLEITIPLNLVKEFAQDVQLQGVIDMTSSASFGGGALRPQVSPSQTTAQTPIQFQGVIKSVRCVKEMKLNQEVLSVLRIGLQFKNSSYNIQSKVTVPRVVVRLEVGEEKQNTMLPLCFYVDDVFKIETLVGKIKDVSSYGSRVVFKASSLPLIEKQKIWLEFILPLLGKIRVFAKIAYLKRESEESWEAGLQFLESFGNCSDYIRDWIYLTRRDFSLNQLKDAGFDLKEILSQGFGKRVVLRGVQNGNQFEIILEDDSGVAVALVKTNLVLKVQDKNSSQQNLETHASQQELVWAKIEPLEKNLQQLQTLALLRSFSLWASRVKVTNVTSSIPGAEFSGTFKEWCDGKSLSWWAWFFGVRPILG
jgi:hypothetical protein